MAAAAPAPGIVGMLGDLVARAAASEWIWRIAMALAIALAGLWLARLLSKALDRVMTRLGVEAILRGFLRNLAYAIALVVVLVAALDSLGVPTTSLLAVLGAAGLAIGLALKDSLSNIASGVMLIVPVRSELNEAIHRDFAQAGVSIPYPQRDLHVYHHDADGRPLAQITSAVADPDRG